MSTAEFRPFEKQTDELLAGGMNLALPPDLVGKPDCVCLDNFRPQGLEGALRSRNGTTAPVTSTGKVINSLLRVLELDGAWLYGTTDGTLSGVGSLAPPETGFGADAPIRMVGAAGYVYATTRAHQKRYFVAADQFLPWGLPTAPAPTLTPTAGGSLVDTVTYLYYVTYADSNGEEGAGASASVTIAAPNQEIIVSSPADPGVPYVTGYNVYRVGNTLTNAYRLNLTPVPFGTPYTDNGGVGTQLDDLSVSQRGIPYDPGSLPPPEMAGVAGEYYGRLLGWSTAANPNRLFWSKSLKYNAWDPDAWVDIGDLGEEVYDVSVFPQMAIVYKTNSIWRIVGDPEDLNALIEPITHGIGLVAPMARARGGQLDYFLGNDGVYRVNGDSVARASDKLLPLFANRFADSNQAIAPLTAATYRKSCCMAHHAGRLYLSYPSAIVETPTANDRTLVYDLRSDEWASDTRAFSALCDAGVAEMMAAQGEMVFPEDGWADNGAAIPLKWVSGSRNQGLAENDKRYVDLRIEANTGGANLTVKAAYNNDSTLEALGTINTAARGEAVFPLGSDDTGTRARNIAVLIEGNTNGAPVVINNCTIHYYVEPRPSLTYDSGPIDFAWPQVKDLEGLNIDIDAAASVALTVYSDNGTGTLASRVTHTIAATPRKKLFVPAVATGRLLRVTLTSATPFFLYGIEARVRRIGLYLDGAAGDSLISLESIVSSGMYRVKEFKDTDLRYDAPNGFTLKLYTDMPGSAMTLRKTISFPASTGARTFNAPFDSDGSYVEGTAYRIDITSTGPVRIYSGVIRVRGIGEYIDGANGESWRTQPTGIGGGSERVYLLGIVEAEADARGSMTLKVSTDLPGDAMASRATRTITTGTSRRVYRFRTPISVKGRLWQWEISGGTGPIRLFHARVYAKQLGYGAGDWQWYELPVAPTEEGWTVAALPIPPTEEISQWLTIPVGQ